MKSSKGVRENISKFEKSLRLGVTPVIVALNEIINEIMSPYQKPKNYQYNSLGTPQYYSPMKTYLKYGYAPQQLFLIQSFYKGFCLEYLIINHCTL